MIDVFTEEAICVLYGLDIDADDYDTWQLEELLTDKAQDEGLVPMLAELIERLCGLVDVGESPLTKKVYKGFTHPEKENLWLVKKEVLHAKHRI